MSERPRPTVLVIEDNEFVRQALRRTLEENGYHVAEAADGEEGLQRYRAAPADVVLTDLMMPGKSGIELIVELLREYPAARIVAMSGAMDVRMPAVVEVLGAAGALQMLPKPFSPDQLLTVIRTVRDEPAPGGEQPE